MKEKTFNRPPFGDALSVHQFVLGAKSCVMAVTITAILLAPLVCAQSISADFTKNLAVTTSDRTASSPKATGRAQLRRRGRTAKARHFAHAHSTQRQQRLQYESRNNDSGPTEKPTSAQPSIALFDKSIQVVKALNFASAVNDAQLGILSQSASSHWSSPQVLGKNQSSSLSSVIHRWKLGNKRFVGAIFTINTSAVKKAGTLSSSTDRLEFGEQSIGVGSGVSQSVRLRNTGEAAVNISDLRISGDFRLESVNPCQRIAVASSCDIRIVFEPATTGSITGQLRVDSDSKPKLPIIRLTGTGIAAPVLIDIDIAWTSSTNASQYDIFHGESLETVDLFLTSVSNEEFTNKTPSLALTIDPNISKCFKIQAVDSNGNGSGFSQVFCLN